MLSENESVHSTVNERERDVLHLLRQLEVYNLGTLAGI